MRAKFEIWGDATKTMLGAITVSVRGIEQDSRAKALSLNLSDWDRTADGLATIVEAKLGHDVTIRTPWRTPWVDDGDDA